METVFVLTKYNSDERRERIIAVFGSEEAANRRRDQESESAFPGISYWVEEFDVEE